MDEDEKQALHSQLKKLSEENDANYQQLQQQVGLQMDTNGMRLNLLIDTLTEMNLFSEGDRLNFELAFHNRVKEALDGVWRQVRAQRTAQRQPKIATPQQGLIVPGRRNLRG